jgi:hypothetical protein
MIRKQGKQTRLLPTRGGLNDIAQTKRTIIDYAKASPTSNVQPNPAEVRVLQLPKGQR